MIGIFDSNFRQLYVSAEPMAIRVGETAKIFTHPLEDGTQVADHRIIDLIEIEVSLLLDPADYRNVYNELRTEFYGNNTFTIQTRTASYPSMTMSAMPHEETEGMFDTVLMLLKFTEARMVKTQFQSLPAAKVRRKNDSSTVKRGEQSAPKGSILHRVIYGNKSK